MTKKPKPTAGPKRIDLHEVARIMARKAFAEWATGEKFDIAEVVDWLDRPIAKDQP